MGHEHNVHDLDAHFIIDPITRSIKNSANKKLTLNILISDFKVSSFGVVLFILIVKERGENMAKHDLSIVRGTSNVFGLAITNADGTPFVLGENQALVFAVKKRLKEKYENRVLVKKVTHSVEDGTFYLELFPTDTEDLEVGRYFYDVGLQEGESVFFNVIEASLFEIKPNISQLGDGS